MAWYLPETIVQLFTHGQVATQVLDWQQVEQVQYLHLHRQVQGLQQSL